jgi:hypothetical protein
MLLSKCLRLFFAPTGNCGKLGSITALKTSDQPAGNHAGSDHAVSDAHGCLSLDFISKPFLPVSTSNQNLM